MSIAAAVAVRNRVTEVREFAAPDIADDAGLLRIEMTGVCGSDWPYYQKYPEAKGALILGHESVGRVEKLGRNAAKKFGVREGDRVALEEYLPCGHCRYCRQQEFRLCDETDTLNRVGTIRYGSTPIDVAPALWGGFAQAQYLHPNSVFHRLPDAMPAALAAMALPLGNGVEWAYLQGKTRIGETVVIQGPGQQGLACVVAAKEAGAGAIIVTGLGSGRDKRRMQLALRLGATHSIDVSQHDALESVAEITGGEMADLVLDCAAGGPETILSAIGLARKAGRILLGGWKFRDVPNFPSDTLVRRFLTVKGMRGHSFEAVEMGLGLLASGKYPLHEMATHVFGLSEVDLALRTVGGEGEAEAIHCAIDPSR